MKNKKSAVLTGLTWGAAMLGLLVMVFLVVFIVVKGVSSISPDLFDLEYNSENHSLTPAIVNTLTMIGISLAISGPVGVFAAIYLSEYIAREGKAAEIIRVTAETLSGIPSIVYGLFGMLFFATTLEWGYSMLSGACTMAIMILPLIMRTAEEALHSVPETFREASFGLGAGRLRTVFRVVLPAAAPGIISGIILAIGKVAGETAALIFTAGTVADYAGLMDSGRSLAVHMYVLSSEGMFIDKAYATAVILLVLVLVLNGIAGLAERGMRKDKLYG